MSNDRPSSEEIAFRGLTNYRQPTDRDIQAGIDASMRQVVRHDTRNVHDRPPLTPSEGKPMGTAGSVNGWRDAAPLAPPPGVQMIDELVQRMLPHGPESKAK
jgi:hypothetical protein